jgi:N-acyl amino acid synthase of PEP-CTERM/exosortase system
LPYLTLGLYLALIALARWQGLEKLFILTEPSLARSLKRLGVGLYPVGGSVLHRGERKPYAMDVEDIVAGLNPPVRELFDTITREIDQAVRTGC